MTYRDEIVEEVRATRDAYAAQFDYDIRKIYEDVKSREEAVVTHPLRINRRELIPVEVEVPDAH